MVQGVDFIMCQAYQTTASVNLKWIMVHELAHVVVTRLAAQKWHMWKMPHGLVCKSACNNDPPIAGIGVQN